MDDPPAEDAASGFAEDAPAEAAPARTHLGRKIGIVAFEDLSTTDQSQSG